MGEEASMAKKVTFPITTLVQVDWQDAAGRSGWRDIEDYEDMTPVNCRSVGFLVKRNRKEVVIGLTQCEDDSLNQCIVIPVSWILKMRILRK